MQDLFFSSTGNEFKNQLEIVINFKKEFLQILGFSFPRLDWLQPIITSTEKFELKENQSFFMRIHKDTRRIRMSALPNPIITLYLNTEEEMNDFLFLCKILTKTQLLLDALILWDQGTISIIELEDQNNFFMKLCKQLQYYAEVCPNFIEALMVIHELTSINEENILFYRNLFLNRQVRADNPELGKLMETYDLFMNEKNNFIKKVL